MPGWGRPRGTEVRNGGKVGGEGRPRGTEVRDRGEGWGPRGT